MSRLALFALLGASLAAADDGRPAILREIGFDQHLGARVPLDLTFRDEAGAPLRLSTLFGARPVVLTLNYYACPMLCTVTLNGLASALNALSFDAGKEFQLVTVSFDPRETPALAAEKKKTYLTRYQRSGAEAGWRFLTGERPAIEALAASVGFRYAWDEPTKQFAHPSGIVVLTPDGRIARYLYGIEYAPRDLRLALVEASSGRIGSPVDQVLLYCYRYDPMTGRYGAAILKVVRAGAILTVLGLGTLLVAMRRREQAPSGAAGA